MQTMQKHFPGSRFLVAAASLVILIAGLRAAQVILVPFLFAMFLAVLGSSLLSWLKSKKVPNVLAVLFVATVVIGVLFGFGSLLGSSANEFTQALPRYQDRLNELSESLTAWGQKYGLDISHDDFVDSAVEPANLLGMFGKTLKGVVGTLSSSMLVIILMVFMLFEAALLRKKVEAALDEALDVGRLVSVMRDVQRYLAIKTCTSALTGLLVAGWAALMGVDFPLLWGLVAFVLNYVPFVGSIVASIPAVLLALVQFGPGLAISLGLGYIVINVGVSNFLEPIFMGRRLGLSPLVVFMSLVFWGWVWGPGGMLLSVPLTMIIKILLEHSDDFQWIAILMDIKPKKLPVAES